MPVDSPTIQLAAKYLRARLTASTKRRDSYDWLKHARPQQIPPGEPGSDNARRDWVTCFLMAGRGFGKTRSGAEEVRKQVAQGRRRRIALVAPTLNDARKLMIEGDSGLLSITRPEERPRWIERKRELVWPNGAVGFVYTTEEPERLRGPQHDFAWCEELGAWRNADACWSNLALGMRITGPRGDRPQRLVTSTPRPTPLIRRLVADRDTVLVHGTTRDNAANLDQSFLSEVMRLAGTRLGEQEIEGKLLGDTPGAMFKMSQIEAARVAVAPPNLIRVVVAIDPAVADVEGRKRAEIEQMFVAETGIVVAGVGRCLCKGTEAIHGFVLSDVSGYYQPEEWARVAAEAYTRLEADRIIAEVNNGGALVGSVLRAYGGHMPYKAIHASRGKATRAEPVATLYEKLEVHHVGIHAQLEDQLTTWNPLLSPKSPDRLDANVWALTDLMLGPGAVRATRHTAAPSMPRRM